MCVCVYGEGVTWLTGLFQHLFLYFLDIQDQRSGVEWTRPRSFAPAAAFSWFFINPAVCVHTCSKWALLVGQHIWRLMSTEAEQEQVFFFTSDALSQD